MQEWSKQNKGYRYMLNVIDVFSKYAWSIPLKDKTMKTTLDALIRIVKQSNIGMTPTEASLKENVSRVLQNMMNKTRGTPRRKPRFKVGDRVRISRIKGTF